jgi:hypothetical protein
MNTMKLLALISALALAGASLHAADADDVKAAAKKLAGQSYSWKTTTEMAGGGGGGGGGQWRPGPTEGRITADGVMAVSMSRGDNTFEAVMKGGKTAVKTPEGWQAPPEPGTGGGGGGPGGGAGMMGRMLATQRPPAAEVEDLVGKVKELKKTEAGYVGDLTEAGAQQLLTRNRRGGPGGGEPPAPQGAKGALKVWLKDGVIAKYEVQVQGRMEGRDGQEIEVNRTTTTEISNVGTTKVEVAEEAKKVLG